MSTGRASGPFTLSTQHQHNRWLPRRTLKRKFDSLLPGSKQGELNYPSPPMSDPPSPPQGPPASTTIQARPAVSTTANSTAFVVPGLPALVQPPPGLPAPAPYGNVLYPSSFSSEPPGFGRPLGSSFGIPQTSQYAPAPPPDVQTEASTAGPSTSRTGRKSKAHVASACINCKRAHLSCDIQRPCARCVASGKQDTCFDVQHKKRGRPRLREEGEFKVEQVLQEQGGRVALPAAVTAGSSSSRPIAGARHRRTESLRSLRSQTSEGTSGPAIPAQGFAPPPALQAPFSYQHPPPPTTGLPAADVPTAYLDLDFVFIRANGPFQQIMSGGQDVRGGQLGEVAAPADSQSFQAIRNALRAEREAREPAYMPPILQAGQDPLQGVADVDVDRLTSDFADRMYTWTRRQPSLSNETFPARVRLAKGAIYFVVVTLPSFRPVAAALPPQLPAATFVAPPSLTATEAYPFQRQEATQSAPPALFYPFPSAGPPSFSEQPIIGQLPMSRSYPSYPPQQAYSYFPQQPPPTTPRLPTAEPPTGPTPFTPRSAAREAARPFGAQMQLPPLVASPSAFVGSSATMMTGPPAPEQGSSGEEDEEGRRLGTPRKRRRMGIDDVLQRSQA